MNKIILIYYFISFMLFIIDGKSIDFNQENNLLNLNRSKRFISFGNFMPNVSYQPCITPDDGPGLCKPFKYCLFDEMRKNIFNIMKFFCRLENTIFLGVCCSDEEVMKENLIHDPDLLARNELEDDDVSRESRIVNNPQFDVCGVNPSSRPKIVGGRPAEPNEWPWVAALLRNQITNYCGGVLITKRHVISAAHCTNGFKPQDIRIRLGEYDFSKPELSESVDYRVINIIEHPEYDGESFQNDISILILHRTVKFSQSIRPICLPPAINDFANKTATIIGWGTQGYGAPVSDVLMEVDIQVWPQDRCDVAFPQVSLPETTLCAGAWFGRKDACQGDSGGPLMLQLPNRRWVTIGVVSFGLRCGQPGIPGLYTRVNQYLSWIAQMTSSLS